MAKENKNYTSNSLSSVITNAVTAFNNIEDILSTMGAKTADKSTLLSAAGRTNYVSAADLKTIIQQQLQLKASGSITINSKTSENGLITGTYTSAAGWTVRDAQLSTLTLSTTTGTNGSEVTDGNSVEYNGTNGKYYKISVSNLNASISTSTAGWFSSGSASTSLQFNMDKATFSFNTASGTITCTKSGYIPYSGTSTITNVPLAQVALTGTIESLTGTPFESSTPTTNLSSDYYEIIAKPEIAPATAVSITTPGILNSLDQFTVAAETVTKKYIKKGLITTTGSSSSTPYSIKPGQTVTISKGFYESGSTVQVSTEGADTTNLASYILSGKKAWNGNNTLVTGSMTAYNSSSPALDVSNKMSLNTSTGVVSISNASVSPAGYYNGTPISGSFSVGLASASNNDPVLKTYSGTDTDETSILKDEDHRPSSYYRVETTPSFKVTQAGYITTNNNISGTIKKLYLTKGSDSTITVAGGGLTAGAGSVTTTEGSGSSGIFLIDSGSGGYTLTVKGKGTVERAAITESHTEGYYPATGENPTSKIAGTSLTSNEATKTIRIAKGAVKAHATAGTPTIAAVAGYFTKQSGGTASQVTTGDGSSTLSISDEEPASGKFYKLTATGTASASYTTSTPGYIKSTEFQTDSNTSNTKDYYIPQATFRYNNTSSSTTFIECRTAGYYPTGALTIVNDSGTSDDIDYAAVIATLSSTSSIVKTGSSVPSGDYEITIAKSSNTNPGYISGTSGQGSITLNTKYFVKKGTISSSAEVTSATITKESGDNIVLHASSSGLRTGYYTLTPKASASSTMNLTQAGYIASVPTGGTADSTAAVETKAYINVGQVSYSGGGLSAGAGSAEFNATVLHESGTDTTLSSSNEILKGSATGLTDYYKINVSGSGSVNWAAFTADYLEGYLVGATNQTVYGATSATSDSGSATAYIEKSSTTTGASLPSGASSTNAAYDTYVKISKGYYPSDRYIKGTANAASVSPTVGAITVTQTSPGSSTTTLTATISGTMSVNIGQAGYLSNTVGTITQKDLSAFNSNSVTLVVKKGALSAAALSMIANSSAASNRGNAKFTTTDPGSSANYVKVTASREALSVTTGYVTNSERSDDLKAVKTVTAYIDAIPSTSASITASANSVNGSGDVGTISAFSDSTGEVTPGEKQTAINVSGGISGTGSFKDKYMLSNVTVSGNASGTATVTIDDDATGSDVDTAISQLYKCILGLDYTTVT